MIVRHEVKQGTPEWHALRLEYPHTASLAPILLSKGKNAATNTQGHRGSGFWAERGHILEDEAIEIYIAVTGHKVSRPGFITNDDYPGCGFSPDGWDEDLDIPIESKSFAREKHLACLENTPNDPYIQLEFGEMISEANRGRLIFYNPDIEDNTKCFKIVEVPRDELLIARFKEKLR